MTSSVRHFVTLKNSRPEWPIVDIDLPNGLKMRFAGGLEIDSEDGVPIISVRAHINQSVIMGQGGHVVDKTFTVKLTFDQSVALGLWPNDAIVSRGRCQSCGVDAELVYGKLPDHARFNIYAHREEGPCDGSGGDPE